MGRNFFCCFGVLALLWAQTISAASPFPLVVNTWAFTNATQVAWDVISTTTRAGVGAALDAVEAGCSKCESMQCDGSVGFGGSPDTDGETTLDAMIMDGTRMEVGAVGDLRDIKEAISVARCVKDYTHHTLLAGYQATSFAVSMGFNRTSLETPHSKEMFDAWKANSCQPNYFRNVKPNASSSCGPYSPLPRRTGMRQRASADITFDNHDTIAMIVVDPTGKHVASGTSTNGANHKVAGRVGDSPVMGAGSYADSEIGACGSTGDGDVMMRFLPCFHALQLVRQGYSPNDAATAVVQRVARFYPSYLGAVVVVDMKGEVGAAAHGWTFVYSIASPLSGGQVKTVTVPPV